MSATNRKELNLDDIKKYEFNLLCAFDELCKRNNLCFTFSFGTMLGAVRHKGFIPWDDDIDLMMPRPDYDRLLSGNGIDFSDLADYMEFYHWRNGKMGFPFIKLVDKRITVEQKYQTEDAVNKLWIDIFPIDGNPEDAKELAAFYKKVRTMRKIQCLKSAKIGEGTSIVKKVIKPIPILAVKLIDGRKLCDKIDAEAKKYDYKKSKYIGNVLWGFSPKDRIGKDGYMNMIDMEFEGRTFKGPSNYHEYLTGLYGNYMELPPEEKRVTHDLHAFIEE